LLTGFIIGAFLWYKQRMRASWITSIPFVLACLFAEAHAAETLILPDGLEAKLWAQTPQLFNPTNIDIDARGRIWLTEGVNYRETWKKQHALAHPEGDRVMILEDSDGDGVCDSSKVYVQDKDLICPLGIAVIGNKTIVSCSPNLIVYTDTDGDDKPDKKEMFLTGFGGKDHDHGLHSLIGFLDGRWYFNVGNDGPHEVRDALGWWLRSGSCYVYGPTGNTGNRKSDDGRVWTGGIALRVDPDGKHLTPLGHNFRNSYEVALDSFGDMWQSDNDDDGNRGCRVSWLMEGANMGYFSADGTRAWGADKRPGQSTLTAHWHQDDPGVVPIQDNTGAGGPTGAVVYESGLLPDQFRGCVLDCDAGRNRVWVHKPVADGAGYHFERSTLIEAKIATTNPTPEDHSNWFRPSDVAVGTDGAIYVADWYDPGVGGHDIRDKEGLGRIFRIAPKNDKTRPPKIDLDSPEGQINALNSPTINIRHQAADKLAAAGESSVPRLLQLVANDTPYYRARAIWVLSRCGNLGVQAVEKIFKEGDERARLAAFRALRSIDRDVVAHADVLAGDSSPALRREAAIALRDVPFDQCKDTLVKLAKAYDGHDRFYLEAVGLACDRKEEAIYPLILAQCGDNADPLKWSAAMAGLAWRLHPRAAIESFAARAASAALSVEQRKQAIDALAFTNDERAAAAIAKLASSDDYALWWAKNRATNDWATYAAMKPFAAEASAQPSAATTRRVADRTILMDEHASKRDRERAAGRLAADPEGAIILIAIAADDQFPKEFNDVVSERLTRNTDLGVRALASQYFPRHGVDGAPLPPIKELVAMKGNARDGRTVFFGNTASCFRCHKFDGEGKDVGPDLTSIRTKYQRLELLDNILNPSANIAFGYEPWIVKMKDGQVHSGFILADGQTTVTLKESTGEQRALPKDQIKFRLKQTISVMPDNVALGLSAQQLVDLADFLLTTPITTPLPTTKSAQK
jgi:putative membrane-bound dehydrogenase-like protein